MACLLRVKLTADVSEAVCWHGVFAQSVKLTADVSEAVCWQGVFAQSVKLTADVSVRLCAGMACLLRA